MLVRQSKSPEDREIGRRFAPHWEVLVPKLQEIFPDRDAKGSFIVPSLDVRAQILSINDRRNGVGKRVFKLAPPGHDQLFVITAPNLCEHSVFLMLCCDKLFVKQALRLRIAQPMCDGHPFAFSPFRRLASRGLFFSATFFCGGFFKLLFYLSRRLSLHDQVSY